MGLIYNPEHCCTEMRAGDGDCPDAHRPAGLNPHSVTDMGNPASKW